MVNGTAECILADGRTAFAVTAQASDVKDAIAKLQVKLNAEFEYCLDADKWQQVTLTIKRSA